MNKKKRIYSMIELKNDIILSMLFDTQINIDSIMTFCDVRLIHNGTTVNIINVNYKLPNNTLGKDTNQWYIIFIFIIIDKLNEYNENINSEFKNNNISMKDTEYYFNDYGCYIKNESSAQHYLIDYSDVCTLFESTLSEDKTSSRAFTTNKSILLNNESIEILLSELNKFEKSIQSYIVRNDYLI